MTTATLFPVETTPSAGPSAAPPAAGPATASATALRPLPPSRAVTLSALPVRTALVRQDGPTAHWFDWSGNPYRGCEFGCGYCYARSTHAWLGHADPREFQERLYVKTGFAEALRRDLRTRVGRGEHVAFGTATDPYQPIEEREGVMRSALRELTRASGLRVSITTKSTLVTRDLDLLQRVAERNAVQVNVTITTPDARLARFLEPRAPTPAARLQALRQVRTAGLQAGVFLMPVLPGITDAESDLRALIGAAADAGAQFVAHQVVTVEAANRGHFLATLRRAYPRIAARYEVWTRTGRTLPADVRREVAGRVRDLLRATRLDARSGDRPPAPVVATQRTFEFAG